MRIRLGVVCAVVCGVLAASPGGACGQTAGGVDPAEYAARSVARVALIDLRARSFPSPDDYLVAAVLLDSARSFAPDEETILRASLQAAWAAGEAERLEELTRELVRLRPRDTVAQLRLASSRIGSIQTVEGRLAAYDRLLGEAGRSIDASVRSRLALDAALLEREHGHADRFAERLSLALELDQTNKEAAQLAWQVFSPRLEDPADRFELLMSLLMADPTDPNVHRHIATSLAGVGAFEQANRFHRMAVSLFSAADSPVAQDLILESIGLQWQIEGPEAVVSALNRELLKLRQRAAQEIFAYQEARMPTDALTRPEDIMLAPRYNQMRLVAALIADDRETLGSCLSDMQRSFGRAVEEHQERAKLSTPEEVARSEVALWNDLSRQLVAIAWADLQDESMREWVDRAARAFGEEAPLPRTLAAWAELRLGDPELALEMFEGIRDASVLSRVGYGLALEGAGRIQDARSEYTALAREQPVSLSGVWARDRVMKQTGDDPLATPERAAMSRIAGAVPEWVDRMAESPRSFMALSASLRERTIDAAGRPTVVIRLTNLAPIPLGVGGDRPINSRFLLAPRLQSGLGEDFARAGAEVVELDRRLRLAPAETLEIEVWPDQGIVGWLAETSAAQTVRQRWRVLQGYRLGRRGVPEPGVLCLETETGGLVRRPFAMARATPLELADALERASAWDLPEVLAAVRGRLLTPQGTPGALTPDDASRLALVAADRYESLPPVARASMLAVLPSATLAPGMEPFDRVALEETDPTLAPVALVTRVSDPEHPAIAALEASGSGELEGFVRSLRARLREPEMTFSRMGRDRLGAIKSPSTPDVGRPR